MIKQLLQMGAMLTIVAFLITGCAATNVDRKFDFSTMREYEARSSEVGELAPFVPGFLESDTRDIVDWAYAHYQGGNSALAAGELDLAEAHFKRSLELMTEGFEQMKETLQDEMLKQGMMLPQGFEL